MPVPVPAPRGHVGARIKPPLRLSAVWCHAPETGIMPEQRDIFVHPVGRDPRV